MAAKRARWDEEGKCLGCGGERDKAIRRGPRKGERAKLCRICAFKQGTRTRRYLRQLPY
ncbi:MAG TPA: hypothetical protein VF543_22495 [Pyrinomonadaceae bacterium]|jgi:hypothetical protein